MVVMILSAFALGSMASALPNLKVKTSSSDTSRNKKRMGDTSKRKDSTRKM